MSNILKMTALLLAFCFAQNLQAQVSDADKKGIEECYNAFEAAFEKSDASTLGTWMTDNVEHISPLGEIVRGRANLVTYFTNLFAFLKTQPKPDKTESKNLNWQSRYLASDLILASYTTETTTHFGDKTQVEKMSFSVLLRKKDNKWLTELITLTPVTPMPEAGK